MLMREFLVWAIIVAGCLGLAWAVTIVLCSVVFFLKLVRKG